MRLKAFFSLSLICSEFHHQSFMRHAEDKGPKPIFLPRRW